MTYSKNRCAPDLQKLKSGYHNDIKVDYRFGVSIGSKNFL